MKTIKGSNAAAKSNKGYIFNFMTLVPTLYPRTTPKIECSKGKCTVGTIIQCELQGANRQRYIQKHNEFLKRSKGNQLKPTQISKLQNYCNMVAYYKYRKKCIPDFESGAVENYSKLDILMKKLMEHPNEKTLIMCDRKHGYKCLLEAFQYRFKEKNVSVAGFYEKNEVDVLTWDKTGKFQRRKKGEYDTVKSGFNSFNPTNTVKYGDTSHPPKIRILIADSSKFSEGVSFFGVRRMILLNPPQSANEYYQQIGRPLRACKSHSHLPEDQRNVHIEMYCSVFLKQTRKPNNSTIKSSISKDSSDDSSSSDSSLKSVLSTSPHDFKGGARKKKQQTQPKFTADQLALQRLHQSTQEAYAFEKTHFDDIAIDKDFYANIDTQYDYEFAKYILEKK